jgi:hydroxyacylglutathione hydrolase
MAKNVPRDAVRCYPYEVSFSIETFVVGPMPNNLYLLLDHGVREVVVVDPSIGSDAARAHVRELQNDDYRLAAIWNTHGHFDHVYDNAAWKAEFGAPILMHHGDAFFLERLREQSLFFGMAPPEVVPADAPIEIGDTLRVGNHAARVLHTPGHSPGSVSFLFPEHGAIISGDVLFQNSVGRTDLPGCSVEQLNDSLRTLCALPPETRVLPGHYGETTVGAEIAQNPYVRAALQTS